MRSGNRGWTGAVAVAGTVVTAAGCAGGNTSFADASTSTDAVSVFDTGSQADTTTGHDASARADGGAKHDATAHADAASATDAGVDGAATTADGSAHSESGTPDAASHADGSAKDASTADGEARDSATLHHDAGSGDAGRAAIGAACTEGTACASGACVDGFCCTTACAGTCMACAAAITGSTNGTCAPAVAGTACGGASCTAGEASSGGTCGGGTCNLGAVTACSPYTCNAAGTACLAHCSADGDCAASGDFCQTPGATTGTCVARLGVGTACTGEDQCASGFCYGSPSVCQPNSCGDGIQDGQETGVDCGGPVCGVCPTVLLAGAGTSGSIGAELHPTTGSNGTWSATTALGAPSVSDFGVAFLGTGAATQAVSVMRYTQIGASLDQALMYATWTPGATTLAGAWVPFASIGPTVTTREVPAIAAAGSTAFVAFQGVDDNFYFAEFTAGAWNPSAEAVTTGGGFPTPPGIAAIGSDATISYFNIGPNNGPTAEERTTSWQPPTPLGTNASYVATPAIVAMNGGTPDLLTAFIEQSDGAIEFCTHTSTGWTPCTAVAGAHAPASTTYGPVERVGLAALPGGGAILAWRDATTSGLMVSLYSGSAWSTPAAFASPNIILTAAPAVTHGVAGATAEMAFVESSGVAYHTRLISGAWTPPVSVGGTTLSHVTISSAP